MQFVKTSLLQKINFKCCKDRDIKFFKESLASALCMSLRHAESKYLERGKELNWMLEMQVQAKKAKLIILHLAFMPYTLTSKQLA